MKPSEIEVGKRYWVDTVLGVRLKLCVAKTDDGAIFAYEGSYTGFHIENDDILAPASEPPRKPSLWKRLFSK